MKVSEDNCFVDWPVLRYPQVMRHADNDDHMCSAPVHMCGEVWANLQ